MSATPTNWKRTADERADYAQPRRLDAQEVRRRLWHIAPGFLPFLLWGIPHQDPLTPLICWIFFGIFVVLTGLLFWNWSRIARRGVGKSDRVQAIFGYASAVLLTLFLFPAHAEIGLALLGILAFGDGSATLIGMRVGGPRLPWNSSKTISGFVGFLLIGLPMTALIYWGESHNPEALGIPATAWQSILVAAAGVVAGAIAESIRSPINDNIRVGIAGATALVLAHAAIIGL